MGEVKTAIDSHHVQIAYAIERYVRIGFEIREGGDIKNTVKDLCEFQLASGWALKTNQKFEKRGSTRISKKVILLLQDFFHAGNTNKSDRYSANNILSELIYMANSEKLDSKIIPRVEMIEN
ncbi:hypothetical protein C1645_818695 [Glomus cerebriforme]|uniref:Uncharacterized protein n=1 Tax=Glomus cerebriforme TaxID=658196 RepID=A0A397T6Q3_9GLOM|nr:hypothetical protein C1645_818695 [Glomus cerebriforme]